MNSNIQDDDNNTETNHSGVTAGEDPVDENMTTFVFGNIKIRDPDSKEVLVNLRF